MGEIPLLDGEFLPRTRANFTDDASRRQIMAIQMIRIDDTIRRVLMPLREDERALLEQSVLAEGIRDPLVVWRRDDELILLDGHHRYELAQKHGLSFNIVEMEFDDEAEAVQWVLRNQLARRNLTDEQRTLVLGRLYNQMKLAQGRPPKDEKGENFSPFSGNHATSRYVASLHGVTDRTVRNAAEFAEAVDAIAEVEPKAAEAILLGKVPDAKTALRKVEPELLPKVAERIARGDAQSVKEIVERIRREERETTKPVLQGVYEGLDIRHGDFREVLADLPDRSVDIILTDPPYPQEYLPLWDDLGAFAARVLKPTGVLLAYSGQLHLPQVIAMLTQHLRWWWMCAIRHAGAGGYIVAGGRRIINDWKPLLILTPRDAPPLYAQFNDLIEGGGRQKELHNWEQSTEEAVRILQTFGNPGALVVDPFAGSGSFGRAAVQAGMRFIGAEILAPDGESL
jgi:16S rRNA G966 N2-methylase RsmD